MHLNEHFIRLALKEATFLHQNFPHDASISIDSRTVCPGDIFVAIKGKAVDGHDYIGPALKAGAAGLIIDGNRRHVLDIIDKKLLQQKLVIAVDNPLEALYTIAKAHRARLSIPLIGITGSIGKTSTKEMLGALVTLAGYECYTSRENQNTKLGVALNLLNIRSNHFCGILECGINGRGEMDGIVDILRPTLAIITGIAHSHLEGLGSIGDIAAEKRAIFKHFSTNDIGIINGDQNLLANVGYNHPVVKFGFKTTNQVQVRKVRVNGDQIDCVFKIYNEKHAVSLPQIHSGQLINRLAASTAAYLLNIPQSVIIQAATQYVSVQGRFEQRKLKNNKGLLIHDAYNASPESMKAALLTFSRMQTDAKKIVVLGDMLELGVSSPFWHRQLGRVLRKLSATHHIILVGSLVNWTKKALPVGASVESFESWQEASHALESTLHEKSLVLVKGSHGTGLYKLAESISDSMR